MAWNVIKHRENFKFRDIYLRYSVQTGSGAHPASYQMGTRGSFTGVKAAGV